VDEAEGNGRKCANTKQKGYINFLEKNLSKTSFIPGPTGSNENKQMFPVKDSAAYESHEYDFPAQNLAPKSEMIFRSKILL
jgi:hypothetical protein